MTLRLPNDHEKDAWLVFIWVCPKYNVGEGHTVLYRTHFILPSNSWCYGSRWARTTFCAEQGGFSALISSAPRGALRSLGHLDDRSAIMIISAVILQVLGSTSLLVEPKMVSQREFWGHLQRPVGEGLGPNYPSMWAKSCHKLYKMCELGHFWYPSTFWKCPMAWIKHAQPLVLPGRARHSQPATLAWCWSTACPVTNGTEESVLSSRQWHQFSPSSVSCVAPVGCPEPQPQGWVLSVWPG